MLKKKNILIAFLLAIVGILSFRAVQNDFGLGRNMEMMINLMRELSNNYVDEIDPNKMMKDGANGITSHLDPYTDYLSEEDMSAFETMTTGKYGGIGSLIHKGKEYVVIAEPYKDSPADKIGLKIGDLIVGVNGEDAKDMATDEVSKRLRGEPGTYVTLRVRKLVTDEIEEYKVKRERITIPSIPYYGFVAEGVAYVKHVDFTDKCYDDMRHALTELQKEGEIKSLIVDYRDNGGGILGSAVDILSLFLPKGTPVVTTKGRVQKDVTYTTQKDPLFLDIPIVMLINGNSASAGEIVPGVLQDLDRAVLIGQRSYGKGLVQSTRPIGYNAFVKLTIAKYYIPSGRCIQARKYDTDGKPEMVPDSLINEYRTKAGRKVYDGAGLKPDLEGKQKIHSNFYVALFLSNALEEFENNYYKLHSTDIVDSRTFSISDKDYSEFAEFAKTKNIPFTSHSRVIIGQLRKSLNDEKYEGLEETIKELETKLHDDIDSNLKTHKEEILEEINSQIVLRFNYSYGVLERFVSRDEQIRQAVELLRNKEEYTRIITTQDTSKK